jgi:hypothetical protein
VPTYPDEKEPFWQSIRFWTAVITPLVAVGVPYLLQLLPVPVAVSQEQVVAWAVSVVIAAVSFIASRTVRNTKVS